MKKHESFPQWILEPEDITEKMLEEEYGIVYEKMKHREENIARFKENYSILHPIEFTEEEKEKWRKGILEERTKFVRECLKV